MARFNVVNSQEFDGLIDEIRGLGAAISGPEGSAVLIKAGNELTEYFKGALISRGMVESGQLVDSIKPTAIKGEGTIGKYLDVYPQGTRRKDGRKKAVRNAEVGFVQEYGAPKKNISATHWMSNTVDDVGEEILDIMQAGIDEIIDKNIGGNT